jgi:hypothetical protein
MSENPEQNIKRQSCPMKTSRGFSAVASLCPQTCAWFKDGRCVMAIIADALFNLEANR